MRSINHPLKFPLLINLSASTTRRIAERVRAAVNSALVSVKTPGVFPTGIPNFVAAQIFTLSYPTATFEYTLQPAFFKDLNKFSSHFSVNQPNTPSHLFPIAFTISSELKIVFFCPTSILQSPLVKIYSHFSPTRFLVTNILYFPPSL